MNNRRHPTIADLAAVALCPALIVLLISSLVYFLIMCVYRGGYTGRIGYIWFMFILGAVGIARLSIQESRKYALGYAAILGGATFFVLGRFMTVQGPMAGLSPVINAATIALIWFLADRITYDCTLIDEDKDASGQGLLDGLSDAGAGDQDARQHASRKRGHQPGRTVLWLTAAALPVFGIGQMMLPQQEGWQRSALITLATYLFAALSLLVVTSFLGVRRYLRQRGIDMPANVSAAWLAGGVALILVMLLASFLLPQPGKMLANVELPQSLESPDWLKPSQYGWGSEAAKPDTEAANDATAAAPGQRPNSAGDAGQPSGQPGGQQSGKAGGQNGDKPGGQKGEAPGRQDSGNAGEQKGGNADGQKGDTAGSQDSGNAGEQQGNQRGEQNTGQPPSGSSPAQGKTSPGGESSNQPKPNQSGEQPSQDGRPQRSSDSQPPPADAEPNNAESNTTETKAAETTTAKEQPDTTGQQESSPEAQSPAPQSPPSSSGLPSLTSLIRGIIYLVLITILLAFAWIQRHEIINAWNSLLAWWKGEPALTAIDATATSPVAGKPVVPFAAFRNPLESKSDPREAVIVTYQAAEAWWREHGQPRQADETPFEYSRRLRARHPAEGESLLRLTDAYNRVVYGDASVQPADLAAVAAVWKSFADT